MTGSFELSGHEILLRQVDQMAMRGRSTAEPMSAIGELMVGSTKETILSGGRPEPFAPWSTKPYAEWLKALRHTDADSYAEERAGGKILVLSSALLHSIDYAPEGPGVRWGTNRVYAARMQFGWPPGSADETPARPYVQGPFPEDWTDIEAILQQWIAEGQIS